MIVAVSPSTLMYLSAVYPVPGIAFRGPLGSFCGVSSLPMLDRSILCWLRFLLSLPGGEEFSGLCKAASSASLLLCFSIIFCGGFILLVVLGPFCWAFSSLRKLSLSYLSFSGDLYVDFGGLV